MLLFCTLKTEYLPREAREREVGEDSNIKWPPQKGNKGNLPAGRQASFLLFRYSYIESLILAQDERWRRG